MYLNNRPQITRPKVATHTVPETNRSVHRRNGFLLAPGWGWPEREQRIQGVRSESGLSHTV